MDLRHEFTVPADVETTWHALTDVERMARCFPGARLAEVEGMDFAGSVKVKLGPISLAYTGMGALVERDRRGRRTVIEAKGKDERGNGTAAATVTTTLAAEGDETRVRVHTDLAVTGKPAQFGPAVFQDAGDRLLGQFAACLSSRLERTVPEPDGAVRNPGEPIPGHAADLRGATDPSGEAHTATTTAAGPSSDPSVDASAAAPTPDPGADFATDSPPARPRVEPSSPGSGKPGADELDTPRSGGLAELRPVIARYAPAAAGLLALGGILFAVLRRTRRRRRDPI